MNSQAIRIWMGTTLLLAVGIAPFLARGDQSIETLKKHNASLIAHLSDSQRNHLLQNEAQFRAATPESRAALQAFHQAMEKDRMSGGELTALMQKYDSWIKTIKRTQREQLASTPDPQERIALMKEIVRNQREWNARRDSVFSAPPRERQHFDAPPFLDDTSFKKIMEALEDAAEDRFTDEQNEELDALSGIKQQFKLLKLLKETGTGLTPKPLLEEPPREFKIVAEKLDTLVEDARIRDFVYGRSGPERASRERGFSPEARLVMLISQSMFVELFKLRRTAHHHVDEAKLVTYLNSLPLDRQYELLSLEASDFQNEIRNQYLDKEGLNDLPSLQDFRELFGRGPGRGPRIGPDRGPLGMGMRDHLPRSPMSND